MDGRGRLMVSPADVGRAFWWPSAISATAVCPRGWTGRTRACPPAPSITPKIRCRRPSTETGQAPTFNSIAACRPRVTGGSASSTSTARGRGALGPDCHQPWLSGRGPLGVRDRGRRTPCPRSTAWYPHRPATCTGPLGHPRTRRPGDPQERQAIGLVLAGGGLSVLAHQHQSEESLKGRTRPRRCDVPGGAPRGGRGVATARSA